MPDVTSQGLDVSAEEQRFLRRTFLRMALPWVAALMLFTWWMSPGDASRGPDPEELAAVKAELLELRSSVSALRDGLSRADRRAAAAAELAESLEGRDDSASASQLAGLEREVRRASQRVGALEKQLGEVPIVQRFDALGDRLAGVEERLARQRTPSAAPSPAPARSGPALPAAPVPGAPQ